MDYGINDIKSLSFKEGMREWCIYKHTLIGTDLCYIGQTNDIKTRWKPSAYKTCTKFYNAINKYSWNNFKHEILKDNLTIDEANEWEEYYIKVYNSQVDGFNLDSGGLNHLHSEETKLKMSKTRKGMRHSKEHAQAISNALKGYKQTKEHKINNRLAQHRKPVECIDTGIIYDSIAEASRQTGYDHSSISRVARGMVKNSICGHWRFVNE